MREGKAKGSELIIFDDGTLYHIDLKRTDNIPPNIFLVGAAERVDTIAAHFDQVTFQNRNKARPEFYIKVGTYKDLPVAVMSTGIGSDNIEIVLNELHALFEYDHHKDTWDRDPARVNLIRVGTSGTSLPEIPVGTLAVSHYALGLDNLAAYYPSPQNEKTKQIERAFLDTAIGKVNPLSYAAQATPEVANALLNATRTLDEKKPTIISGITTSSPGFFAPEGRSIGRIKSAISAEEFRRNIINFQYEDLKIVNHEMETGILFRIGHEILGYRVGALCLIMDNLSTNEIIDAAMTYERLERGICIALDAMARLTHH